MRGRFLFGILTLVLACAGEPTSDIFAVVGIVRGQVTNPEGIPVSGAWVALDGVYPLSNGNTIPVFDSIQTDAGGLYRGRLALLNLPDTLVTFDMRIWPPAASGLAPDETLQLGLRLTREPAQDTLVMNVQLSP
jgi:hypothetical protein